MCVINNIDLEKSIFEINTINSSADPHVSLSSDPRRYSTLEWNKSWDWLHEVVAAPDGEPGGSGGSGGDGALGESSTVLQLEPDRQGPTGLAAALRINYASLA